MDLLSAKNDANNTMNISSCTHSTPLQCLQKLANPVHELGLSSLFFLIILATTVLGNSMVIIAVLRFKTLHSAINFLIFGLAVADLFVGLFVMPYAVYVHVSSHSYSKMVHNSKLHFCNTSWIPFFLDNVQYNLWNRISIQSWRTWRSEITFIIHRRVTR